MDKYSLIKLTEEFVRQNMEGYDSGHDWWHIDRVRRLALHINKMEALADPFLVEITALLHDTADSKFAGGNMQQGYSLIGDFMDSHEMSEIKDQVLDVIKNISFSNKNKTSLANDPLLWVIRDADRLDAIGAIGIARAFNYGGFRNNRIYDPIITGLKDKSARPLPGNASTISHFYEKLLLLKDLMHTDSGKRLAGERHEFLEIYLLQFYKEWEFSE